ncbi:prolyl oligopeptidase family serine peptidase [Gemmatimonas sp.]|jgi:dipeptidyl aminopeptidase/acylaminoacyl peptidase|uniref:S9 family peptidase n=1 Tax=Gemmatimonas sp. TaxID=1962908 RepID=UPI0037C13EEF
MRRFLAGLVLTPFVLAPVALSAQAKPLLSPADYGQWQTVGQFRLSPRGDWVATGISRVNEENELQLRGGPRDTTIIVPYATQPAFTATNAWVGYLVGVSPTKRDSLTTAKKPVRTSLVLRPLAAGALLTEPDIQTFTFSADGRFAAATRYPAEGKRVSDVVVYDLATGSRFTLQQVSEQVWSERGSLLAVAIEGEAGSGSSVQLYDAATNTLKVLAAGPSPFRALAWRMGTRDLAVLQSRPDPAFRDTAHVVHLFSDVSASCACLPTTLDATRAVQFPQGMRIAEHRRPVWSADGRTLFVGLRPREPQAAALKKSEEKPSDVEIWHPNDVRMFRQQMAQEAADLRRTLVAAWHIAPNHLLPLTTDLMETATVLDGGRFVTEADTKPYPWEMKFGRNVTDVYAIDANTGARTKVATRTAHWYGGNPTGTHVAYGDGRDYWVVELVTGRRTNLTATITRSGRADFVDHDDDHPSPIPHQFAIAGWAKDGTSLLVHDTHDVWQLPVTGGAAVRLTNGAPERIRYRLQSFAPVGAGVAERAVDLASPVYFTLTGRRTKASGWARRLANGTVERLAYGDAAYRALVRADSAAVMGYVRGRYDTSPNVFVGPDVASAKAVTATNPFQANHAWGKVELIDFRSTIGQSLQGLLYYPANYDPSKKYPLIVYTYERLTDGLHNYIAPNQTNYYNTTVFTQQGYFVLHPDIVFRPREPGLGTQHAVEGAVKAVLARGHVDPARVGHVGHSQGGYEAAFLGTRSKLFATTIVGSGITDMISFAGQLHWSGGSAEFDHWETGQFRMQVAPWEDFGAMLANSPLTTVHRMPAKSILVMIGSEDGTVEPRQGTLFYNYARRAGKQVVLLQYPGEGHGLTKKENQRDYQTRILQWFGHYLKGDAAPAWITRGQTALERRAMLEANK